MSPASDQHAVQIAERFKRETASHELTILHEDGLYRHLRMEDPQHPVLYRIDLITWPNGLAIRGDGPNFLLSLYPTVDLFDMVRGSSSGGINPGYWQQQVRAGKVRDWSEAKFRSWLTDKMASAEAAHPGLVDAVREQILDSDEYDLGCEEGARTAVAWFDHDTCDLEFPAKWERDFDDWSWEYLWACHALVRGIAEYDRVKAGAPALTTGGAL